VPHLYFHLQNDVITLDRDGIDVPDMEEARAEATATVAHILLDRDWNDGKIATGTTASLYGCGSLMTPTA
jgi:hypothetical protein